MAELFSELFGVDIAGTGWALLVGAAMLAGWVDAVIGGGGLILIPVLMAVAPGLSPASVLATNKLAAVSGTASAAWALIRKIGVDMSLAVRFVPVAALCSGVGAVLAASLSKDVMRPAVIVLLLTAGTFVALRPQFGQQARPGAPRRKLLALLAVALIAFYDGIFGPGTGMFLIMAFTALLSEDLLRASALTKVVNTSTNLGALAMFIAGGHVLWLLGIVLALANVAGAQLGARTVLAGGTKFLRFALLTLVVVMSIYLSIQQFA
ncbi:TSUP family transporter [Corynebacterium sp. 153RC1]|uniref:TSUP family transporter n=1 Tax=unclassified Corynebacterium TaxID=2624378 RepID=UPI00211CC6F0|nr:MULTISPECIES: TSUP family transporter [unclassified Corynebacterium]MCQ9352829.1 TSUP family transporter [Corynebacterium sp. 209RC1]MCQ9355221.1 TSUP family transporter [Corynebacterium sp. 1222RC1]MCQ9357408.1 TSUP family transporter [Corynebacterium sp. 122RC1]MCQ9359664.1 TSUP family transporter [Corynebacterium sp. 142RC1]MCQ9361678.1 TSUP family transporter [Corynebacterium sp. 153RC1]